MKPEEELPSPGAVSVQVRTACIYQHYQNLFPFPDTMDIPQPSANTNVFLGEKKNVILQTDVIQKRQAHQPQSVFIYLHFAVCWCKFPTLFLSVSVFRREKIH